MKKKDFLIVVAAMLPLSVFAAGNPTVQESFNKLDSNQDGYISQQEAQADKQLTEDWSKVDTNKDGKIEESEFSAFEESMGSGSGEMPSSE